MALDGAIAMTVDRLIGEHHTSQRPTVLTIGDEEAARNSPHIVTLEHARKLVAHGVVRRPGPRAGCDAKPARAGQTPVGDGAFLIAAPRRVGRGLVSAGSCPRGRCRLA